MRYDCKEKKSQVEVDNIFYYVPIEATLRLVLRSKDSQNLLTSQLTSNQDVLEDWVDGANGSEHISLKVSRYLFRFILMK